MKVRKAIITAVAILMFGGALALDASAQTRGRAVVKRPVIVRPIIRRPYWYYNRFSPYRGYSRFYNPYWDSPYMRYQEEKFRIEQELRGNQRELEKHEAEYRADGVITAKERRELEDDYKDVRESRERLNRFLRNN